MFKRLNKSTEQIQEQSIGRFDTRQDVWIHKRRKHNRLIALIDRTAIDTTYNAVGLLNGVNKGHANLLETDRFKLR